MTPTISQRLDALARERAVNNALTKGWALVMRVAIATLILMITGGIAYAVGVIMMAQSGVC